MSRAPRALLLMAGMGVWLGLAPSAEAVQRILVADESAIPVRVSARDVNVITAPTPVLQAVTSKADIDVKTNGRHVLVTTGKDPGELVILTDQRVYVLQLKPELRPAETIILVDDREDTAQGAGSAGGVGRESSDYLDEVTTLIQTVMRGEPPAGFQVVLTPENRRLTWVELETVRDLVYVGSLYEIRRIDWRNDGTHPQTLRESSFYTGRELAIALDHLVIDPGVTAIGVLVYPATPRPSKLESALPPADR